MGHPNRLATAGSGQRWPWGVRPARPPQDGASGGNGAPIPLVPMDGDSAGYRAGAGYGAPVPPPRAAPSGEAKAPPALEHPPSSSSSSLYWWPGRGAVGWDRWGVSGGRTDGWRKRGGGGWVGREKGVSSRGDGRGPGLPGGPWPVAGGGVAMAAATGAQLWLELLFPSWLPPCWWGGMAWARGTPCSHLLCPGTPPPSLCSWRWGLQWGGRWRTRGWGQGTSQHGL